MDISVIVCTYNPTVEELKSTLDSIIKQRCVEYEIIISDDGSKSINKEYISDYFNENHIYNYVLNYNKDNQGTVLNIKSGVELAKAKYVFPIGQGDMLADENVLKDAVEFMNKNNVDIMFTGLIMFRWINNEVFKLKKTRPRDLTVWKKKDINKIKENVIVFNDQISGACLFYSKEYCVNIMKRMSLSTLYMEDLCQYIALLDENTIYFYDRDCIMYECEGGISNSKDNSSRKRMLTDKNNFLNYIFENYSSNHYVRRRKVLESIERSEANKLLKVVKKIIREPKWIYFRVLRIFY